MRKEYVVIDIETSGLNPIKDDIIKLSAIRVVDGKIVGRFKSFANIGGRSLSKVMVDITGITDDMLVGAPSITEALSAFYKFVGSTRVVGYNVIFDEKFLSKYSDCIPPFSAPITDVMLLIRGITPKLRSHRLDNAMKHLNIERTADDCENIYRVLETLDCVSVPKITAKDYTSFCACPKQFWLQVHKPESGRRRGDIYDINSEIDRRRDKRAADELHTLAWQLFDGIVDATVLSLDGTIDEAASCEKTKRLIAENCPVIANAAFCADNLYCAVDILKKQGDTWNLYAVRAVTVPDIKYAHDFAFQHSVLRRCGIIITDWFIIFINSEYIRNGNIEPRKLLNVESATFLQEQFLLSRQQLDKKLLLIQELYESAIEPQIVIHENCRRQPCPFCQYCWANIPRPSIFDLRGMGLTSERKFEIYNSGIRSFQDIRKADVPLNPSAEWLVRFYLCDKPQFVDKAGFLTFLSNMKFPLYFLNIEIYRSAIPRYDGLKPFQKLPHLYSVHILKNPDAENFEHKAFRINENDWKTYHEKKQFNQQFIHRLLADIPPDGGSVITYNSVFVENRIMELAETFPDFKEQLLGINARLFDLARFFKDRLLLNKSMICRNSIWTARNALIALSPEKTEFIGADFSKFDTLSEIETLAMTEIYKILQKEAEKLRQLIGGTII